MTTIVITMGTIPKRGRTVIEQRREEEEVGYGEGGRGRMDRVHTRGGDTHLYDDIECW